MKIRRETLGEGLGKVGKSKPEYAPKEHLRR